MEKKKIEKITGKKYNICYNSIVNGFDNFKELKQVVAGVVWCLLGRCGFIDILLNCKSVKELKEELEILEKRKNIKIEIL